MSRGLYDWMGGGFHLLWICRAESCADNDRFVPYSVYRYATKRYFWCVWKSEGSMWRSSYPDLGVESAAAFGYAPTYDEADDQAKEAAEGVAQRSQRQARPACHSDKAARFYYVRLLAEQRLLAELDSKKTGSTTESIPPEYIYEWDEIEEVWLRHVIVRRTAKRIYIECRPFAGRAKGAGASHWSNHVVETIILARDEFEQTGRVVYWKDYSRRTFSASPANGPLHLSRPKCIEALGIVWPCTRDDIRREFRRRSRVVHPDVGGNHEAFIALRTAYEQALRLFSLDGS